MGIVFCEEDNNYVVINEVVIDNTLYNDIDIDSDSDSDSDSNSDNDDNGSENIYIEYGYYTP
jgi:hypothetical protein